MTRIEPFGTTEAGETVHRIRISGDGLDARVMTWGAVVQDLRLDGHAPPLVLGFADFSDYPAHSPYFGAIAGRTANRIAEGRFTLDGRDFQLDRNFLGRHNLHGGAKGFGKRVWTFADHGADFVTLELTSADGDMGYPGRVDGPVHLPAGRRGAFRHARGRGRSADALQSGAAQLFQPR